MSKLSFIFKPLTLIALTIIGLIILYMFSMLSIPKYVDYLEYYTLEKLEDTDNNKSANEAIESFNTKNFKVAEKELTLLFRASKTTNELEVSRGFSLIQIDNFRDAERVLNTVIKEDSTDLKHKASWYLALGKLKQRHYNSCRNVLTTIPNDALEYEQAQELLSNLN